MPSIRLVLAAALFVVVSLLSLIAVPVLLDQIPWYLQHRPADYRDAFEAFATGASAAFTLFAGLCALLSVVLTYGLWREAQGQARASHRALQLTRTQIEDARIKALQDEVHQQERLRLKQQKRAERYQRRLISTKPIVFTDRTPDGETRITNLGNALAANVWYLADDGRDPVPLGSLGEGKSRVVPIEVADRHILIAEARQMPAGVSRKFTPTLNAWNGQAFAHSFIQRMNPALHHRGSMKDYLLKSPRLIEKLRSYDPFTYDADRP